MRPNIENYELEVPFRVIHYEVLEDWEGAGEFRGSPGTHVVFVADTVEGVTSYLMTGNSDGLPRPGVAGDGRPQRPSCTSKVWTERDVS